MVNAAGRVFGMTTSANSTFYTHWALESFFKNTILNDNDEFYLIDNDNVYSDEVHDRVIVIKNQNPMSFAQNVNQFIDIANQTNKDLIFLSNDVVLTPGWLEPLELTGDKITVPSCNQTHQYSADTLILGPSLNWSEYRNRYDLLSLISARHIALPDALYFDKLLMPLYLFRLPVAVYKKIGRMDEDFVNGGEDIDYRLRAILQGINVEYVHNSYILHFNGKSTWRSQEDQQTIAIRNKKYQDQFDKKWGSDLSNLMLSAGDANSVLIKHNILNFDSNVDTFSSLIKHVHVLTN